MTGLQIPFTGLKKQYSTLRTEILDATDEVLRSGQLMSGNYTAEFENWLARRNHSKYAVTCHSGTQALEIIARYYRLQSSVNPPRVVIPSMTYVATANAFLSAGWDLYIADTDYHGLLDKKKIPNELSVQATVVVGLYGSSVDELEGGFWATDLVIEDGAQHWLSNDCRRWGNATAISFDPMKNLNSYGNGGAVVTDDLDLLEFARTWRSNGRGTAGSSNSRMSEVDCAQMMVKTQYIDEWQERRKRIATYWMSRLKGSGIRTLIDGNNFQRHAFHKFVIEVDNRDILQRNLALKKIETRIHYEHPVHELPVYSDMPGPDILSVASAMSRRVLTLPFYPELTDLEVEYIIDQVLDCASQTHK